MSGEKVIPEMRIPSTLEWSKKTTWLLGIRLIVQDSTNILATEEQAYWRIV